MELSGLSSLRTDFSTQMSLPEQLRARQQAEIVNQTLKANDQQSEAMMKQEDFLALLTTQLKYQDPLQPMDNKEWVSQMASFSSLQADLDMNDKMDGITMGIAQLSALNLSGRMVEFVHGEKVEQGLVEGISVREGIPSAIIDGQEIAIGNILTVMRAPVGATIED